MNARLGKTGVQEGTAITAVSLITCGLFSVQSGNLYGEGNASYITLPASLIISLAFFLIISYLIERSGQKDLGDFLTFSFGKTFGGIAVSLLFVVLIVASCAPILKFVQALHGLFFEGVSYSKLVLFILPAVFIIVLLGFETIGRTAKCYSMFLLAVFLISVIVSSSEFDVYRLYPLPGRSLFGIVRQSISETGLFLPVYLALLSVSDALNGMRCARNAGITASVIAGIVIIIAQLSVSLVYTYEELSHSFMPLFRVNYLNMFEAHFMRMDKLAHITWLNGAMLTSSFLLFAASYLFIKPFSIRDIRPTLAASVIFSAILILIETECRNTFFVSNILNLLSGYLPAAVCAVILLTTVFYFFKSSKGVGNAA